MRVAVLVLNYLFLSGLLISAAFMGFGMYMVVSGQIPQAPGAPAMPPAQAIWALIPVWAIMYAVPVAASVTSLVYAHKQASK